MDTITHALSGALAARLVAPGKNAAVTTADCMVLGAAAAAFPDTDVVLSYLSPLAYLYHHRGVTHSVLMLPLWTFLLAAIWSFVRRNRAGFAIYALIAAIGLGVHILGDLITSFGTMIFAPFSAARLEWGTTFIIDLWFTGIILAGLALSAWYRASRVPALIGLAVLCGYVGLQWIEKQRAIGFGVAHARENGLTGAEGRALGDRRALWKRCGSRAGRRGVAAASVRVLPLVCRLPGRRCDRPWQPVGLRVVSRLAISHAWQVVMAVSLWDVSE
jgi:inner membrane protein